MEPADRDETTKFDTVVVAECIACKHRKEIRAGEVAKDDVPMCKAKKIFAEQIPEMFSKMSSSN